MPNIRFTENKLLATKSYTAATEIDVILHKCHSRCMYVLCVSCVISLTVFMLRIMFVYLPTEEDPDTEVETSCKKLVPVFGELSFVNVLFPA